MGFLCKNQRDVERRMWSKHIHPRIRACVTPFIYLLLVNGVRGSLGVLPAPTMRLGPLDTTSRLGD